MAVYVPLPERLQPWATTHTTLLDITDEAEFNVRLAILEARVQRGNPPSNGAPPLSGDDFEAILDVLRPIKDWPIRPTALGTPLSTKIDVKMLPKPMQKPFSWRWLLAPLPAQLRTPNGDTHVSIAVAKLGDAVMIQGAHRHLLSLSSLWHLMPLKDTLAKRLQPEAKFWDFAQKLGVDEVHFVRSNNSIAKLVERRKDVLCIGDEEALKFPMYMGTTIFLLAFFGHVLSMPKQLTAAQKYIFDVFEALISILPASYCVDLPAARGADVRDNVLSWAVVQEGLLSLGLTERWIRFPPFGNVNDTSVPMVSYLCFLLRHSADSEPVQRACLQLLPGLSIMIDDAFEGILLEAPRRCSVAVESDRVMALVAKGSDKAMLLFNSILGKRQGPQLEEDQLLREVARWKDARWCVWAGTVSLVATYLTKALAETSRRLAEWTDPCVGCRLSFDDSRVASMEIMLSHLVVAGILITGPAQVKPDQAAMFAQEEAFTAIERTVGGGAGGRRSGKPGAATLAALYSVVNVLLTILPIGDLSVFIPSSSDLPSMYTTRVWTSAQRRNYNWNSYTKKSVWCIADELIGGGAARIWILCLVADEGSTGTMLFFFLVGVAHLRCIFWRDPSHRLSNLFVRSLRGVPEVFKRVCDHLIVHKFRRAPYGNGTMFKEAKETIALILSRLERVSAVVNSFVGEIARDHSEAEDPQRVVEFLAEFTTMAMGGRVEMRRWFTYLDNATYLDTMWHTLLLALVCEQLMEGKDPWHYAAAAAARPVDEELKDFHYKQEVLRVLMDGVSQGVLRSVSTVFEVTRYHHGLVIAQSDDQEASLRFIMFWASKSDVLSRIIMPTIRSSLCEPAKLSYIGIDAGVPFFSGEGVCAGDDGHEAKELLFLHLRLVTQVVYEWWVYSILPQSPPWCFASLLSSSAAVRTEALQQMRAIYDLLIGLESSRSPTAVWVLRTLFWSTWAVVREPMNMFAADSWDPESPIPVHYIRTMVGELTHSLMEEEGFNTLRENEQRGAKNHQRGEAKLSALAIASNREKWEKIPGVEVEPEDVASFTTVQVRKDVFHPALRHQQGGSLGVDTDPLLGRRTWKSSSMDQLALNQMCLLRALLLTGQEDWENLWLACLAVRNTIIADVGSLTFFYVVGATRWILHLWRLEMCEEDDDTFLFAMDAGAFVDRAVTSLDQFIVYKYDVSFSISHDLSAIIFKTTQPMSLVRYRIHCGLSGVTNDQLKKLCVLLGASGATANRPDLIARLLAHLHLTHTADGKRELEEAKAAALKRLRQRRARSAEHETEGSDSSGHEEDDGKAAEAAVPPLLAAVAPAEVKFMLGQLPTGAGLNEEEESRDEPPQPASSATEGQGKPPSASSRPASTEASSSSSSVPGGPPAAPRQPDPNAPRDAMTDQQANELTTAFVSSRVPNQGTYPCPPGCAFRHYVAKSSSDKPYFEAKVPKGMRYQGQLSKSACYGPGFRSRESAFAICKSWIDGAGTDLKL